MHDTFEIQLSLARMAAGIASRNRADPGCAGTIWQIERLEAEYRKGDNFNNHRRADKLRRIIEWYNSGGPIEDLQLRHSTSDN